MGSHINKDGEFQSDKYPTCPPGKVPLSVKDPMAQDLLWEYAERRRDVDAEFAGDLKAALFAAGYRPKPQEVTSKEWLDSLLKEKETDTHPCDAHPSAQCMCKGACSCHFVQVLPIGRPPGVVLTQEQYNKLVKNSSPPTCPTCGSTMNLRMWDRPGGPPGNGWGCPKCHPWPERKT